MNAFKSLEGKKAVVEYYNMLLAHSGISHERITVNTRHGETFVLAAGDVTNPPVILLHGSSMNSVMWIKDMDKLSQQYRVYAPDMPGEPGQSDEEQLPFDSMDYVDWLADVLAALKVDHVMLVGISLGAWLAAKYAIAYPQQVHKLVLLCPAGIGGQNHAFKDIAMSLLIKGEAGVDELFQRINGNQPIPEIMLNYQKLIAAVFNSRQEVVPLFADKALARLAMPSMLIVGEKDIMLNSLETAKRYARLAPNATVVVRPDAGHSLVGLADEILEFISN